ncbi:HAD family hydrolase [Clostridium swellfunianum]|uniref:HAD family hydrolase n=1 Tax=Clostridium swellfunianum TaxID=1367462 RepID=UPI0020300C0D|nr:HAD family hydrolase [Clostridium swellfunianum]MCM0650047.1 HAD family hydrolase [Clostridium swellfunianum]
MNKPKMVIFDYGQTLVNEKVFDTLKGTKAVLSVAANNPNNVSAEEVQALANQLSQEIGRYGVEFQKQTFLEVHNHFFQNYLYEYFGIQFTKSAAEIERIFQNAACIAESTKNIESFLQFLEDVNIRTSVISNISFSGDLLKERINYFIPSHKFEFIIASSEYVFRKPHKRIFELALRKAKLDASDVWYCGDNAVFDVDGAANCGLLPVWYKGAIEKSNKYIPKNKCLIIDDWNELIDKLKML